MLSSYSAVLSVAVFYPKRNGGNSVSSDKISNSLSYFHYIFDLLFIQGINMKTDE